MPPCVAKRKATSMRFAHPQGPTLDVERAIFPDNKGRVRTRTNQDAMMLMDSIGPELHTETCIAYAICTRPKGMRPS